MLERSIVTLDRELDEASTALVKSLSMADPLVPTTDLPPAYYLDGVRYEPAERKLLSLLLSASGRCVRRRRLYEEIVLRGSDGEAWLKLVQVRVSRLRRKLTRLRPRLKAEGLPSYINTYWSEGYSLTPAPTVGRDGRPGAFKHSRAQ